MKDKVYAGTTLAILEEFPISSLIRVAELELCPEDASMAWLCYEPGSNGGNFRSAFRVEMWKNYMNTLK